MKELHKKSSPLLLGILASALVALPVVPATFVTVAYGVLGGDGSVGGYGAASHANTAWWAPIATVGAPLAALVVIIGSGVYTARLASRRQKKS